MRASDHMQEQRCSKPTEERCGAPKLHLIASLCDATRSLLTAVRSGTDDQCRESGRDGGCMRATCRFAVIVYLIASSSAFAHGGGLDKDGCHTNRKTGDYHCHRGGGSSSNHSPNIPTNSLQPTRRAPARPNAFANCPEARAAGAAPVYRGEPGYGPHLDRDGDGVGCEPYRGR